MLANRDIFSAIEQTAPRYLAEDWDNTGLQIGSYSNTVNRVLLTLDVTEAVVDEAIDKKADLIVSHHPFLFKGLKSINIDSGKGKVIQKLIDHRISVYSAHTNLDAAGGGLNHYIADLLEIKSIKPLVPSDADRLYKLVVYSPVDATDAILKVLGENRAGSLGNYSHCTFRVTGKGTFKPLTGSAPYIGTQDQIQTVSEDRIEAIIGIHSADDLITKIKAVHPYEQMAYDLFPMDQSVSRRQNGLGIIGELEEAMMPDTFMTHIKNKLELAAVRTTGNPPKQVKRVALCTGSGSDFITTAKVQNADCFITGDLKYHEAQTAEESHIWVIDAGHYGTEKKAVFLLKAIIDNAFDDVETMISTKMRSFIETH